MAVKKTSNQDPAPLALRSRADLMASPVGLLVGQARTEEQAEILRKAETDFLRQRVIAAKELVGQQLITRGAEGAAYHYIGFVKTTQALRLQVECDEPRHKVEIFLNRLEEDHGNALLATHYIAEERQQEIIAAPVDPPQWHEEEYEIEVPNLFQQIFGGHTTTKRVRR